jgi:hypothetical protein
VIVLSWHLLGTWTGLRARTPPSLSSCGSLAKLRERRLHSSSSFSLFSLFHSSILHPSLFPRTSFLFHCSFLTTTTTTTTSTATTFAALTSTSPEHPPLTPPHSRAGHPPLPSMEVMGFSKLTSPACLLNCVNLIRILCFSMGSTPKYFIKKKKKKKKEQGQESCQDHDYEVSLSLSLISLSPSLSPTHIFSSIP